MKKRVIIGAITTGLVLLGVVSNAVSPSQSTDLNNAAPLINTSDTNAAPQEAERVTPTCDGTTIAKNCAVKGIDYSTYIYHPAVEEKSHKETVTTYKQEVASYCTLCNDGTYSPSCATGRGACSHHGGVAEWNAPRYSSVPVYSTKKVIDTPARKAYYEKVAQ